PRARAPCSFPPCSDRSTSCGRTSTASSRRSPPRSGRPSPRFVRPLAMALHLCRDKEVRGMPEKRTIERAKRDRREGKAPSTQAGEFVREEIEHVREGKH